MPAHASIFRVWTLNEEQYHSDPQKAPLCAQLRHTTHMSSKSVHRCGLAPIPSKRERSTKNPKRVTIIHVFAQSIHVLIAPHGFARVVTLMTQFQVSSKSVQGKETERKSIYIAPFILHIVSKRSYIDHAVLSANCTMPVFPFQMALPLTEVADIKLQLS